MATVRPLLSRDELNFVDRLVPDPSNPPSLEVVRGYVGDAADAEHRRIYLDLQLTEFVDVPAADIKLIHRLPESVSPLGESYVWFARSAEVIHGAVGEERRSARFLEGRLTANRSTRTREHGSRSTETMAGCSFRPSAETPMTNDTSPACCMPKPPKPGPQTPAPTTHDTSPACCGPKREEPGKPTQDTSPACCAPKPRAAY